MQFRQPIRNDLSQPAETKENSGWQTPAPLSAPMEDRTTLRMVEELPPPYLAMGALLIQLPRHATTRLHVNPVETSMRLLLVVGPAAKGEIMEPSWKNLKVFTVEARPNGLWNLVTDYVTGSRLLRFRCLTQDAQGNALPDKWNPGTNVLCGADGAWITPARTGGCAAALCTAL
jgi:hypothetical protein